MSPNVTFQDGPAFGVLSVMNKAPLPVTALPSGHHQPQSLNTQVPQQSGKTREMVLISALKCVGGTSASERSVGPRLHVFVSSQFPLLG